ncbi:MAG: UDP-N-acetylmuramoyl-L-alanyl-D-glutamate--2,6-diaminopimelate ligase [Elusimicrobiota bacterium]|jgi:UDP-N-acetylmuramoyl-L-alanyl-D-glutamate--2,6-diaminopimelate ligase|nr:UDP-N-acetylmuramoyl-L-alanyl-D-glutamate--2,6-diaminopimelate ligase [Elusimicrobiota bacterium]
MKIKEFLDFEGIEFIGDESVEIVGISYDSRTIEAGFAFFALDGHFTDGKKYIGQAVGKGAKLIISDIKQEGINCAQIIVSDVFRFMALFSRRFYSYPDKELTIIAITGTNGKTSVSYMTENILSLMGKKCAVIGTVNYRYGGKIVQASNTTPQSADLYKMMREMAAFGIEYLIMEVSSHSLALGRVLGIEFDIAAFTNLTRDHLDFHRDMNDYFEAKASLFNALGVVNDKNNQKYAIINIDDEYGKRLSKINNKSQIKTYSAKIQTNADFKAANIKIDKSGSSFDLLMGQDKCSLNIGNIGLHNIYNALTAAGICFCCGVALKDIAEALEKAKAAPGRLERVDCQDLGFEVFVDYAHTDDALKNVLSALKEVEHNKILTVFGCGGDRDRTKRPIMGKIAAQMSDFAFVTSDNPRTEDPNLIILDIELGIKRADLNNYKVIVDREIAIKEAIFRAQKDDIILIAGKGHEDYQILGTRKIHFDDREIAAKYIDLRKKEIEEKKSYGQKEFKF